MGNHKLRLSIAVGNYDRMRPLIDGDVQIDGVDPVFMLQEPEEIFFRAFRHADYDVCELSLSSYSVKTAAGTSPYIAVPVFPSRAFRHTSVYVRADRGIEKPEDLKGKRIGVPEYQLTANVWVRLFLEEARRSASVVAGCACQGVREIEGPRARAAQRDRGDQGDLAVRRRPVAGGAQADGLRFLVVRVCAKRADHRPLPRPALCGRAFQPSVAAARAVPSREPRKLQGLIRIPDPTINWNQYEHWHHRFGRARLEHRTGTGPKGHRCHDLQQPRTGVARDAGRRARTLDQGGHHTGGRCWRHRRGGRAMGRPRQGAPRTARV